MAIKVFRVLAYVALSVQFLGLLSFIVEPLVEDDFSSAAWEHAGYTVAFLAGFAALGDFYDRTPASERSNIDRFIVNGSLCVGGLGYLSSYIFFRWGMYQWALGAVALTVLMLFLGRQWSRETR